MDDSQSMELIGSDTEGLYTSQLHDWIPLCPELGDAALRLYWIMRSLVVEKYGPVRKLTVLQLAYLLPKKAVGAGEEPQPSSKSRIRNLLRELSTVGLISTPEGKPVTTSSRAAADAAPLRIRIHDKPRAGYAGPRNAFAHLDSIRPAAQQATQAAIEKEALRRAARRAGQNSDPLGQDSDPPGQNSDPLSGTDLQERDLPFSPSAHTSRSSGGGSLRPSVSVGNSRGSDTDGRTDGSGVGIESEKWQTPTAGKAKAATATVGEGREVTPGEELLQRIGRYHPEIAAGLAMGTTLRDQARVVDGLLLSGVSREEIRSVLLDRPYPPPAEWMHTMASLIAGRLAKILPPPPGYNNHLPVQASAPRPETTELPPSGTALPAAHRACHGEIGNRFCERLALPGSDLCERCTKAAGPKPPEGPEEWQQAVAVMVAAVHESQ